MSFPNIPDITPDIKIEREDVINLLLASIAFEELGLAHLVNAEAEKIQKVVSMTKNHFPCMDDLLKINESVDRTVQDITKLEMLLQYKLRNIMSFTTTCTCTKSTTSTTTTKTVTKSTTCTWSTTTCKKKCHSHHSHCHQPLCGKGCITNKEDPFYGGFAILDPYLCTKCGTLDEWRSKALSSDMSDDGTLNYIVRDASLEASKIQYFKALAKDIIIEPAQNSNVTVIRGTGYIFKKQNETYERKDTGSFILTIANKEDKPYNKFKMIISSPDSSLNHNSGWVRFFCNKAKC